MWSDNETIQDLIGFKVHADLIRNIVIDKKMLPITIGVFGDWGGGKTSIMKMIEFSLCPDSYIDPAEKARYDRIACIYFNGWLFEGYDDAKAAILTSILLQLGEHKRFGPKIRNTVVKLIKSVNWMRLAKMGFQNVALPAISAYLSGGISLIPAFAEAAKVSLGVKDGDKEEGKAAADKETVDWESLIKKDETSSSPMDVRSFRERFEKMLKESDIDSLIVLIDDLDRCSPERIIDNLEAIKLFLNVDKTAFIIGADKRIVRNAIGLRYAIALQREEPEGSDSDLATDYLEKLIQVPYHLPRLSPAEIESYMVLLFCQKYLTNEKFQQCLLAYETQRSKNRFSAFRCADVKEALKGEALDPSLIESLAFCSTAAPLITEGLKGNPRQVKRFLNAFILRKQLASIAKLIDIRDDVLVKLMVLEYAHINEFLKLYKWQSSQDGFPKEIGNLEKVILPPGGKFDNVEEAEKIDSSWATSFMRKWISMTPALSNIDLRDYFWVSRDKLSSTLSDLTLVPPVVRLILEELLSGESFKQNHAVTETKNLTSDETTILIGLLSRSILSRPDSKPGYDAFRKLIEQGIPGSVEAFVKILQEAPSDKIPPAIGLDILSLLESKTDLKQIFQPAVDYLKQTKSKIGSAMKKNTGV